MLVYNIKQIRKMDNLFDKKSKAKPEAIAREYLAALQNPSESLHAVKVFLKYLTDLINFEYETSDDAVARKQFHLNDIDPSTRLFIFNNPNSLGLVKFDKIAANICKLSRESNCVPLVIELLQSARSLFDCFVNAEDIRHEHFVAAVIRLGMPLLKGTHDLTKTASTNCDPGNAALTELRNYFFDLVRKGIRFASLSDKVVNLICGLFEHGFNFQESSSDCLQFYYDCLISSDKTVLVRTLSSLKDILESEALQQEYKNLFLTFLSSAQMTVCLCNLAQDHLASVVIKTLELMNAMIRQIDRLDFWHRTHLHCVFVNIFKSNAKIRALTATLCIEALRKRLADDDAIFQELLDFYLSFRSNLDDLQTYVNAIWDEFDFIKKFLNIVAHLDATASPICNIITANFTIAVCERMMREYTHFPETSEYYKNEILDFLRCLPALLTDLRTHEISCGVLLKVFTVLDFKALKFNKALFEDLVDYIASTITDDNVDLILVENAFLILQRLSKERLVDPAAEVKIFDGVYVNFLAACESWRFQSFEVNADNIKIFESVFMKLCAMLQHFNSEDTSFCNAVLDELTSSLLERKIFTAISMKDEFSERLEAYAITIYSECLKISFIRVLREEMSTDYLSRFINQSEYFKNFLTSNLILENRKTSVFLASAMITAFIELLICLQERNKFSVIDSVKSLKVLTLDRQTFNILIDCIKYYVFEVPVTDSQNEHPLRIEEQQRNILKSLNLLNEEHIALPTNAIWKIVYFYGSEHKFNPELSELMKTLYNYESLNLQKGSRLLHILPIAILRNLKSDSQNVKSKKHILSEFKKFILKELPENEKLIIQAHIILQILDMYIKELQVFVSNGDRNRLAFLPLLIVLVNNYAVEHVKEQIRRIRSGVLTIDEKKSLRKFEQALSLNRT